MILPDGVAPEAIAVNAGSSPATVPLQINIMIAQLVKKVFIKAIKKRVLKRTQLFGDYENATSFIINAPMREWRSRLWLVENVSDGVGFCCTDENVYRWLTRR